MKNAIISLILFLSILGFVFFANTELIGLCDDISSRSIEIESLIKENKLPKAYENSVSLLNKMQNESFVSSVYINHTDLDDLITQAVRLTVLVDYDDKSEALATLHLIRFNSERIKSLQEVNIENIF